MRLASHAAAFAAGAAAAVAATAIATPRPDAARFVVLDAFAQTIAAVENSYVDPVDEKALIYNAARGMVANLDPHSAFLPPDRYQKMRQDTEGEFGGVGVTLRPGEIASRGLAGAGSAAEVQRGGIDGRGLAGAGSAAEGQRGGIDDTRASVPPYPIVDEVTPGSPADVAGLQVDDAITAIDGAPTAEVGHELRDAGAWEAAMRGASGTRVTISALRTGWTEPRPFVVVRAQVKQPSVRAKTLAPRIGYVAITRFAEATSGDVQAALRDLRAHGALDVLVLDLRSDPGGLIDQAIATADLFVASGTIVSIHGRRGSIETHAAHAGGPAEVVPIVALVDQGTASAAEILAAALRDHDRATLVGVPTYGKGTVQTFFDLDDGSGLKLTTARYYTPNGRSLDGKGIVPDVRVEGFVGEVITAGSGGSAAPPPASSDDPQLAAAVQLARQALRSASRSP